MRGAARFVCTDPDVGDLEFADVESVLDALEAGLVQPATPLFDAIRQSVQPVGSHPEVRAAWAERLRYRPASVAGLGLPELPSLTALARSLPVEAQGADRDLNDGARRRQAYDRMRHPPPPVVGTLGGGRRSRRVAALVIGWAVLLLALVGWVVVTFAVRLTDVAARAATLRGPR